MNTIEASLSNQRTPPAEERGSLNYTAFFKDNCITLLSADDPIRALFQEQDKEVVSQEKIRAIAESFFGESLEQLLILSFILPTFFSKEDPIMKKIASGLMGLKKKGKTYYDGAIYLGLLLLGQDLEGPFPVDMDKLDLPLIAKDFFEENVKIPSPLEYLPLALFAWIVFLKTEDERAKKVAMQIASWQYGLLTDGGALLVGPWVQEKEFSKANLYAWSYLLLSTFLGNIPEVQQLYLRVQELPMELLEKVDPLTYFIAEYLEETSFKPSIHFLEKESFKELRASLLRGKEGVWALSLLGNHTGLGSFAKKRLQITSFGPHFFPLGEIGRYGIERGYNCLDISDKWEKEHFQGWTQAVYLPDQGRVWLQISLKEEAVGWKLQIRTEHLQKQQRFAFVFFVNAKSAEIGHKVKLLSSSLDRYVGQKEAIQFSFDEEKLLIEPQFSTEQEVIPLAGMDHFWGSDFLVSHTIVSYNEIYEWIIK